MLTTLLQPEMLGAWLASSCLLIIFGAAILVPYRAGFINLGLSAQLIVGAIAATYIGHYTGSLWLAMLGCFVGVFVTGMIPVVLRCAGSVNEVLSTLLMTFAAIPLAKGFLRVTTDTTEVASPRVIANPELTFHMLGEYVNVFHLLAVPVFIATALLVMRSVVGYRLRVLASAPSVFNARQGFYVLSLATVFASVAASIGVIADTYVLEQRYANGAYDAVGFVAIVVALLTLGRPLLLVPAAMFVAATEVLFVALSVHHGVPQQANYLVYGLAVIVVALFVRERSSG